MTNQRLLVCRVYFSYKGNWKVNLSPSLSLSFSPTSLRFCLSLCFLAIKKFFWQQLCVRCYFVLSLESSWCLPWSNLYNVSASKCMCIYLTFPHAGCLPALTQIIQLTETFSRYINLFGKTEQILCMFLNTFIQTWWFKSII